VGPGGYLKPRSAGTANGGTSTVSQRPR